MVEMWVKMYQLGFIGSLYETFSVQMIYLINPKLARLTKWLGQS